MPAMTYKPLNMMDINNLLDALDVPLSAKAVAIRCEVNNPATYTIEGIVEPEHAKAILGMLPEMLSNDWGEVEGRDRDTDS